MNYKNITITGISLIILSGCASVLVPNYDMTNKTINIDKYQVKNVISYEKKINKRIAKNSRGLIKIFTYNIESKSEVCKHIKYVHAYVDNQPGRNGTVTSHIMNNISKNDKIEKINNIYFIHKPNDTRSQYYIYSKDSTQEHSTIMTDKKCFLDIKKYFNQQNK